MKKQKFYPKQVANKLNKKSIIKLDLGEKTALNFFSSKGRKYSMQVLVVTQFLNDYIQNLDGKSIMDNVNSEILIKKH